MPWSNFATNQLPSCNGAVNHARKTNIGIITAQFYTSNRFNIYINKGLALLPIPIGNLTFFINVNLTGTPIDNVAPARFSV